MTHGSGTSALFGAYFNYHLRRLERFSEMLDLAIENQQAVEKGQRLAEPVRQRFLAMYGEVHQLAEAYDREAAAVPGQMMVRTRANQLTRFWKEWVGGYDPSLDGLLKVKQFAAVISVSREVLPAGRPFSLRVQLRNTGVFPWAANVGHRLEIRGDAGRVGLPDHWDYEGAAVAFGDIREIEIRGIRRKAPARSRSKLSSAPYRNPYTMATHHFTLRWK